MRQLLRGRCHVLLSAFLLSSCVTKSPPSSPPRQAETSQASEPKVKRPFPLSAFAWLGSLPSLVPRKAKPPHAQLPRLIGVIKTVNKDDRFVLIDAATFQAAEAGDLLICIKEQKETANLRMSTLKNPPFLIADIASGNPAPGDRVFKP
ncbi:MAG TPA: hypothetical protein VIS99_15105 [Terrimicrobiaceae bacterium]